MDGGGGMFYRYRINLGPVKLLIVSSVVFPGNIAHSF